MSARRRVRSLRLAAPDERLVRRGAFLVEDALGTATLPWAGAGRLLLVRSLDLGRFGAALSPSGLALRIERRMRELAFSAVHALDPAAPRSPAVFFRDAAEAHALLALRLARAEEASAWFWRSGVPAWRPEMPRGEALRALLFSALETPARVGAALELVRALERDLDPLLEALAPADGPVLLRACGWRLAPAAAPPRAETANTWERWTQRWGAADARSAWLAAVLKAVERPALAADPLLPARPSPAAPLPAGAAAGAGGGSPSRDAGEGRGGGSSDRNEDSPSSFLPRAEARERTPPAPGSPEPERMPPSSRSLDGLPPALLPASEGEQRRSEARYEEEAFRHLPEDAELPHRPRPAGEPGPEGEPTRFAGLYFLLPVLARLGIAEALSEADLPARVLDLLARRLGALPDDPVRAALLLPAEPPPASLEAAAGAWLSAARRWCRLRAGLGLRNLAQRPGRVAFTPTHVDVFLDLRRVDLRVRRAGLDLDPGWLPWLGRVVAFHYQLLEAPDGR